MNRFHSTIGFPDYILDLLDTAIKSITSLEITQHSIVEMLRDKNTIIPIPDISILRSLKSDLFEVYEKNGVIEKFVIRNFEHSDFDYTYVISKCGMIITSWSNVKDDIPSLVKGVYVPKCLEN